MHELPIIFLTAKNLISDLEDGFEVGANDFLTKPIAKSELVSRTRTHLQLLDINRTLEEKVNERTLQVRNVNRELTILDDIVTNINQEIRFDRLLAVLLAEAKNLIPATEHVLYWQRDKKTGCFDCIAAQRFKTMPKQQMSLRREDLLAIYVESGRKLEDGCYLTYLDQSSVEIDNAAEFTQAKSMVAMTVTLDDELVGLLVLENMEGRAAFDAVQSSTLARFRTHVISALSKATLMDTLKNNIDNLKKSV